jgi:hypothetical protein
MKLDKKFKKAWVEALLSGKYEQACFHGQCNGKCVLEVGAIVKFGTSTKWQEIFIGIDYGSTILEEFWKLNDNENLPFEVFAGVINEWL